MITHEDDRRILESWPEAKLIIAKTTCTLGDHYHKVKTEKFVVLIGRVAMRIDGMNLGLMDVGKIYTVSPTERHSFEMEDEAVMIGLCSHPYDPTDDYK